MLREKKGLKSPKKLIEKALLFKRIMFDDLSTVLGLEFLGDWREGGGDGEAGWLVWRVVMKREDWKESFL